MLEASPRWNRQRMAVLEAADFELRRMFAVLYLISSTSALIYMVGWLRFNLLDLPVGPLTYSSMISLVLTALAGVLCAAMLPAIAVALSVERLLQRRIVLPGQGVSKSKGPRRTAELSLPHFGYTSGGAHERQHFPEG